MPRASVLALLIIVCGASLHCQSYTEGLQQSTGRVDESSAISTLRTITQAQTAYSVVNAGDYGTFEQLVAGGHLDARFNSAKPKIYGYVLNMNVSKSAGGESSYDCTADPDPTVNRTGRHFHVGSASPELHVNATRPATANDEVLKP